MTTEPDDEILIGLVKLDLKPGDVLGITMPDWPAHVLQEYEHYFRHVYRDRLAGVTVMLFAESMRIGIRRGSVPRGGSAELLRFPAPSDAVN